jgi:hypothetical protein
LALPFAVLTVQIDAAVDSSLARCDFSDWAQKASIAALTASDVDLQDYTFRMFVLPEAAGGGECAWTGLAYSGCTIGNCRSFVRQPGALLMARMLGISAGMRRALMDINNDGIPVCTDSDEAVRQ